MASSTNVKSNVSSTMTLEDGTTPTALALASNLDKGDLSISGLKDQLNEVTPIQRRGQLINLVKGARKFPTFTFGFWFAEWQDDGSSPGNLFTFLTRQAGSAYAAAVSTMGDGADVPFTFDLTWAVEGTNFNDAQDHTITLTDCHVDDISMGDAEDGTGGTISGTVYGPITGDLSLAQLS